MIVTTIRIDEELYEKIAKIAREEERSTNSQISYILKKFIEEQEKNEKE